MDSLRIDSGVKRLMINDDPENFIEFNPKDIVFAEKFYKLMSEFKTKLTEYEVLANQLDKEKEVDELNIPVNAGKQFELLKEACGYVREKIDYLFGADTSQKVFGDLLSMEAFAQFFEGILPYIQTARSEKVDKYANKPRGTSAKRKVMS